MVTVRQMTATGLSHRQLDYWTTLGYLKASPGKQSPGHGRPRTWPDSELEIARRMVRMVGQGVPPSAAGKAARSRRGHIGGGVCITLDPEVCESSG